MGCTTLRVLVMSVGMASSVEQFVLAQCNGSGGVGIWASRGSLCAEAPPPFLSRPFVKVAGDVHAKQCSHNCTTQTLTAMASGHSGGDQV